jgi:integrase
MTLRQLGALYVERYVDVEKPKTRAYFETALRTIYRTEIPRPTGGAAPFGDWRLADIVTDTIERFREVRRANGATTGVNRNLQSLRALLNWAVRVGYLDATPFHRHGQAVVKVSRSQPRSRRLDADHDEEDRLLLACGPHLRAVVECALETGMRRGEILSLQWGQVAGMLIETKADQPTVKPWTKTKTRKDRRIPLSSRLRAILELRRFDPAGKPLPGDKYVFGTEIGTHVRDIGRAWETAVLKSHDRQPRFTGTCNLTPESRAALDAIDLHFHDLRREAGSRWLEGGVPLHTIRDWLGHTSIAQTSTYLAGTMQTQHDAMAAYEDRRSRVTLCGTDSRKGGRKSPRSAARSERNPNKTAVGRDPGIM